MDPKGPNETGSNVGSIVDLMVQIGSDAFEMSCISSFVEPTVTGTWLSGEVMRMSKRRYHQLHCPKQIKEGRNTASTQAAFL